MEPYPIASRHRLPVPLPFVLLLATAALPLATSAAPSREQVSAALAHITTWTTTSASALAHSDNLTSIFATNVTFCHCGTCSVGADEFRVHYVSLLTRARNPSLSAHTHSAQTFGRHFFFHYEALWYNDDVSVPVKGQVFGTVGDDGLVTDYTTICGADDVDAFNANFVLRQPTVEQVYRDCTAAWGANADLQTCLRHFATRGVFACPELGMRAEGAEEIQKVIGQYFAATRSRNVYYEAEEYRRLAERGFANRFYSVRKTEGSGCAVVLDGVDIAEMNERNEITRFSKYFWSRGVERQIAACVAADAEEAEAVAPAADETDAAEEEEL